MSTSCYVWKCPCGGESGFTMNVFSPHCEKCGKCPNDWAICDRCGDFVLKEDIQLGRKPPNLFSAWEGICKRCARIKQQNTQRLISVVKETFRLIADNGEAECKFCGKKVKGGSFGEILERLGEHWEKDHKTHLN